MSKGHDAMRAHRVKPHDVPFAMQAAAHSVVQRRRMNRDRWIVTDFADSPQRLGQDSFLRQKLRIESQRGPVAAAALFGDRARRRATQRARRNDAHQLRARESFLDLGHPNVRDIAGIDVRGEDRKTVDARERRAAGHELSRRDSNFIPCIHASCSITTEGTEITEASLCAL